MKAASIAPLVRKLHGWELLHLREHAAELQAQIEALQQQNEELKRELEQAWNFGEMWQHTAMQHFEDDDVSPGLTQDGRIVRIEASIGPASGTA